MATIDLLADEDLLASGSKLEPSEYFAADETWTAVELPTGQRVTAEVKLQQSPYLELVGAVSCNTGGHDLAKAELEVDVVGSGRAKLNVSVPIDVTVGWWRIRGDLPDMDDLQVVIGFESRVPDGCSLVLRTATIHHSVPLEPRSENPPVQILLISVDTLRADAIDQQPIGAATPRLDEFAAEAETFSRHYAAANWTKPSHASLLTGFHPDTHGALDLNHAMDPSIPTLAERFQAGGLRTAALVFDCGWLDPKWGFEKGFDRFRMTRWRAGRQASAAARWIVAHRDESFFFFVHTFEPHSDFKQLPYEAPGISRRSIAHRFGVENFGDRGGLTASTFLIGLNRGEIPLQPKDREILRSTYEAGVTYLDEALGELFDQLRSCGVWHQLLVVVTSDHGEQFGEHGGFGHGSNYEEVIRVPLLIKWPGSERAGQTCAGPSSSIDLAPTLLEHAGLAVAGLPGVVLGARSPDDPVFCGTLTRAVIAGNLKGVFSEQEAAAKLFDLATDPAELTDIASRNPEKTNELRNLLSQHRHWSAQLASQFGGEPANTEVELDTEDRERLRILGYLD